MRLSSSSTSSSDAQAARRALSVLGYTALWLVCIDVGVGALLAFPDNPRQRPTALQRFLDFGTSVETKLGRMVGQSRETSAPIAWAGWIDPGRFADLRDAPSSSEHVLVAAYGQSFTELLLSEVSELDPGLELRFVGGPAAPLSHSYAMYRLDRGRHRARVAVIGVLASTMPRLASLTNMTSGFEAPQPCTYPRYVLKDGQLAAIESSVQTFEDLQAAMAEPSRRERFISELESYDAAYDPFVFRRDLLDLSTIGRMLRRGVGQKHARDHEGRFVDGAGFVNHAQILDVARAILGEFAAEARRDGVLPFVVLINNRGYRDYLYRALAPSLERMRVPYFSTHERAPDTGAGVFLKDGHYVPKVNRALAADLRDALRAELGRLESLHVQTAADERAP